MSESSPAPLDFERWSTLSAKMLGRSPEERDAILEGEGVELDAWDESDAHWLGMLKSDVMRGDLDRAKHYGLACAEETKRRQAAPAQEAVEAARPEPGPAPLPARPPTAADEVHAAEPHATPAKPSTPQAPAVPWYEAPPIAEPIDPRPKRSPPAKSLAETSMALPVRSKPLPFGGSTSPGFRAPIPGATAAPKPARALGETSLALPIVRGDPLPFGGSTSPGFRVALLDEPPATDQAPTGEETMAIPTAFVEGEAALPFGEADANGETPSLTLEQFASMCAELQVTPDQATAIAQRYAGSTERAARAHRAWMRDIASDRELAERFRVTYERFWAWLSKNRR